MSQAIVYHAGKYEDPAQVRVPFLDRGFLFGDGVFETLRTYGKKAYRTGAHLARLRRSAAAMEIPVPWTDHELTRLLEDGIERISAPEVGVRFWVTRGSGGTGYEVPKQPEPELYMLFQPLASLPAAIREKGVTVVTAEGAPLHAMVKTLGNPLAIQAQLEARRRDAYEVVRISSGKLLEGSRSNIFLVTGDAVSTPRLADGVLDGITRQTVIDALAERGTPVLETSLTRDDAVRADEIFLTRTSVGVVPVVRLDDRVIGSGAPGPRTRDLMDWFAGLGRTSREGLH